MAHRLWRTWKARSDVEAQSRRAVMGARARMLAKSISTDRAVAELSCDSARLLFTWSLAHADNLGRMAGEPAFVKATVAPRLAWTHLQIERWLGEMAQSGLIIWYEHDGLRYLWFPSWSKHQRLRGNMAEDSELPCPPENGECIPRANGVSTVYARRSLARAEVEVEVEGEVEGEVEEKHNPESPPATRAGLSRWWIEQFHARFWPLVWAKVSKQDALAEWQAIEGKAPELLEAILAAVPAAAEHQRMRRDRGDEVLHPHRWLKKRRWEDEGLPIGRAEQDKAVMAAWVAKDD